MSVRTGRPKSLSLDRPGRRAVAVDVDEAQAGVPALLVNERRARAAMPPFAATTLASSSQRKTADCRSLPTTNSHRPSPSRSSKRRRDPAGLRRPDRRPVCGQAVIQVLVGNPLTADEVPAAFDLFGPHEDGCLPVRLNDAEPGVGVTRFFARDDRRRKVALDPSALPGDQRRVCRIGRYRSRRPVAVAVEVEQPHAVVAALGRRAAAGRRAGSCSAAPAPRGTSGTSPSCRASSAA